MKQIILYLFFFLAVEPCFSQTIIWEKAYNATKGKVETINAITANDSTITTVSLSHNSNYSIEDTLSLIQYDLNGNIKWVRYMNAIICSANGIIQLKNSDYLFYRTDPSLDTITTIRYNKNGNFKDSTKYFYQNATSCPANIIESLDKEIFIAVDVYSTSPGNNFGVLKIDSVGNQIWYKTFPNQWGYGNSILINHKGNYIIYGSEQLQHPFSPADHPYFFEVTPDTQIVRQGEVIVKDSVINDELPLNALIETSDYNYLFSARVDTPYSQLGSLTLMDSTFTKKWTTILRPTTGGYLASRVFEIADSSFVVLLSHTTSYDIFNISKTGAIISKKTFAASVCQTQTAINDFILLKDGSAVVSGNCGYEDSAYIARLGNIGSPVQIDTCKTFTPSFSAQQTGDSLQFLNTSNGGYDYALSSQWKFADSTSTTIFNAKIYVTGGVDSVWARLIATNGYGCTGTVAKKVKVSQVTSINQNGVLNSSLSVNVFPNPFTQSTVFNINGAADKTYKLSILNSLGETVQAYDIKNQNIFTFNRSGIPAGLYFYVLSDEEGKSVMGKLVVE